VAGAAVLGRLGSLGLTPNRLRWQLCEVAELLDETPRVKTILLAAPEWAGHRAGQHVDVRLTADDGYQAQRSYSIASAPEDEQLALTVERLEDGEVSSYLAEAVVPGDKLELRGPIGGYFVWEAALGGPVLLVAGGSGIVPLMAMARHRARAGSRAPMRLLYSARAIDDVIYREELEGLANAGDGFEVFLTLTRAQPSGWTGHARRIDAELLAEVAWPADDDPLAFVCGPTAFVETAASALVELGLPAHRIKTERFGPTGG
jgi:ferredoxin-NADP reductase